MKGLDAMKVISVNGIDFNVWNKIGEEWYLITCGDKENGFNTMAGCWGFAGSVIHKNVFVPLIRPTRYTYEFMEKNELFTISFFDKKYHETIHQCGSCSGRDHDKIAETGLTPKFIDGTTTFEEAALVLVCKKLYGQRLDPSLIIDEELRILHSLEPSHKMYIGEIIKAYAKE